MRRVEQIQVLKLNVGFIQSVFYICDPTLKTGSISKKRSLSWLTGLEAEALNPAWFGEGLVLCRAIVEGVT